MEVSADSPIVSAAVLALAFAAKRRQGNVSHLPAHIVGQYLHRRKNLQLASTWDHRPGLASASSEPSAHHGRHVALDELIRAGQAAQALPGGAAAVADVAEHGLELGCHLRVIHALAQVPRQRPRQDLQRLQQRADALGSLWTTCRVPSGSCCTMLDRVQVTLQSSDIACGTPRCQTQRRPY